MTKPECRVPKETRIPNDQSERWFALGNSFAIRHSDFGFRKKLPIPFPDPSHLGAIIASVVALSVLGFGASCRTPPLPPADFSAPGWRVLQGQAIWNPAKNKAELAGELLLATNANGNSFVQFGKTPFPLATAQVAGSRWQIEFGSGDYECAGNGQPPPRFVWFQLPSA